MHEYTNPTSIEHIKETLAESEKLGVKDVYIRVIDENNIEFTDVKNRRVYRIAYSNWNACIPLENPQEDIKKLYQSFRKLKELRAKPLNFTAEETEQILKQVDEALALVKEA